MAVVGLGMALYMRGQTVTVAMYDVAHLRSETLTNAEQLTTQIFSFAGIDVRWTAISPTNREDLVQDFSAVPPDRCAGPLQSTLLRVQVLPHAPRGFSLRALGYSLPCAQRGVQVVIYADRVCTVSSSGAAGFDRVLGHALAHEIGHVLLRSSDHDGAGVMKDVWTASDWQHAAVMMIPFTPTQARRMAEQLR